MRYQIYVNGVSNGQRFATMQKAGDTITLDTLARGKVYIHDTDESGYFTWFEAVALHAMAGLEVLSLDETPTGPNGFTLHTAAYWVCDDGAYNVRGRNGVSYHVPYGDPWGASGTQQDEFDTLKEAIEYMRHHTGDDPIFRVKLARRHGEHTVTVIKGTT